MADKKQKTERLTLLGAVLMTGNAVGDFVKGDFAFGSLAVVAAILGYAVVFISQDERHKANG